MYVPLHHQNIVELKNNGMNNIESSKGEIVMYQPDETIRLEVRVEDETVWLSQAQMAELFGTKRQAITKHLQNIYDAGKKLFAYIKMQETPAATLLNNI